MSRGGGGGAAERCQSADWRERLALARMAGQIGGVFTEFTGVKQEGGAGRRRWFEDDGWELIVWYERDGAAVEGFQLCYPGSDGEERALTWHAGRGFSHARVDGGDARPDKNLTPVLMGDGEVVWPELRREFAARSGALEPELHALVARALDQKTS